MVRWTAGAQAPPSAHQERAISIEPEDSLLEEAQRRDLPSADTEARLRRRLMAAGVVVGNGRQRTASRRRPRRPRGLAAGWLACRSATKLSRTVTNASSPCRS